MVIYYVRKVAAEYKYTANFINAMDIFRISHEQRLYDFSLSNDLTNLYLRNCFPINQTICDFRSERKTDFYVPAMKKRSLILCNFPCKTKFREFRFILFLIESHQFTRHLLPYEI